MVYNTIIYWLCKKVIIKVLVILPFQRWCGKKPTSLLVGFILIRCWFNNHDGESTLCTKQLCRCKLKVLEVKKKTKVQFHKQFWMNSFKYQNNYVIKGLCCLITKLTNNNYENARTKIYIKTTQLCFKIFCKPSSITTGKCYWQFVYYHVRIKSNTYFPYYT